MPAINLTDLIQGDEGHTVVRKYWDVAAYSKENEEFAPKFFIRGGDLYSMTNNTHMLRVAIHNQTDPDVKYPVPNYDDNGVVGSGDSQQTRFVSGPKQRYKLKLVETSKFDRNVGVGEGKYLAGSWAWHGPILVYTFHLTGSLFYSCWDGVYLDVQLYVYCYMLSQFLSSNNWPQRAASSIRLRDSDLTCTKYPP